MKTLKIKTAFAALVLAVTTLVSCSKEEKIAPQPEVPQVVKKIEGTWIGKYGTGNVEPDEYFAANIKENGVMEIIDENNEVKATGTWELADDVFSGKYKYTNNFTSFVLEAKYDKEAGKITGSWGVGDNAGSGDFYWNKQ